MTDAFEAAEVRIVRVQPGDIIVLRSREPLSQDAIQKIHEAGTKSFGAPVVVLDGLDIDIVRKG